MKLECVESIHVAQDRDRWEGGFCWYGNEHSGSVKGGEFLEYLSVLENYSAPR